MTDRERKMIEGYLPHPRDPELGVDEYYVLDTADRVRRVYVTDLMPNKDRMTYGVYEVSTGKRIDAGYGSPFVGFAKSQMYDNKQDCRDQTHLMFDGWEELRKLQESEAEE